LIKVASLLFLKTLNLDEKLELEFCEKVSYIKFVTNATFNEMVGIDIIYINYEKIKKFKNEKT